MILHLQSLAQEISQLIIQRRQAKLELEVAKAKERYLETHIALQEFYSEQEKIRAHQ